MTIDELREQWESRRAEGARLRALVPLELVATEVLDSLRQLDSDEDVLSIVEAAKLGGYSCDHLCREIKAGRIPNAGRKHKPAIRRADVPRKPGHRTDLPSNPADGQFPDRRRIVLDATTLPSRSA